MKKQFLTLIVFFLIFLLIPNLLNRTYASHKTFQDNFDDPGLSSTQWITSGPQLFNGDGTTANWTFYNGWYGMKIINQGFQYNETIPKNWDTNFNDYTMEVDMKLVNGVDTNLVFRYQDHDHWYGIHGVNNANVLVLQKYGQPWSVIPQNATYHFTPGIFYHFRIEVLGENLKVFINGQQIWDIYDPGTSLLTGAPGLQASTGAVTSSEVWFDNFSVTSIDDILAVPYFSQNIQPWGPTEYDHASSLNFTDTTMDRWGCTVTSAAMILNYHGMKEFGDGTPIDPGTLNDWLKDNNGYQISKLSDGSFNSYLFLPRIGVLTKNLLDAGKSNVVLKHNRPAIQNPDIKSIIDEDLLTQKIPVMLKVTNSQTSSHFVVATGVTNNTYSVNDPEWNASDLSFFDKYIQVDQFIPTHTNLSYIGIISNPDVELLITDSLGRRKGKYIQDGNIQEYNEIPNSSYQFDTPISNPNSEGIAENFGTGGNVFLLPEPDSGAYQVTLSSNTYKEYSINLPTQDEDGGVLDTKYTGTVNQNSSDIINLNFDQQNASSSSSQRLITFQSTLDDVNEGESLGLIGEKTAKTLKRLVEQAWDNFQRGHTKQATMKLNNAQDVLESERGDGVSETEYQILIYDIDALLNSL